MPTTKRAWLYVIRNPKRTVLLLILLAALMTISLLGLALYSASGDAVKELRSSIGGYFTIQQSSEGTRGLIWFPVHTAAPGCPASMCPNSSPAPRPSCTSGLSPSRTS